MHFYVAQSAGFYAVYAKSLIMHYVVILINDNNSSMHEH